VAHERQVRVKDNGQVALSHGSGLRCPSDPNPPSGPSPARRVASAAQRRLRRRGRGFAAAARVFAFDIGRDGGRPPAAGRGFGAEAKPEGGAAGRRLVVFGAVFAAAREPCAAAAGCRAGSFFPAATPFRAGLFVIAAALPAAEPFRVICSVPPAFSFPVSFAFFLVSR
jgi:hypothetical protein